MQSQNSPKRLGCVVLLVEDIDNMRVATARMLLDMGVKTVHQARNGVEALNLLKEYRVDLVISDWMMPKMDGLALLKHLRKTPATAQLPFLMSTSVIEQSHVKAAIEAGVSGYVAKPYNYLMLQERVDNAFDSPLNLRKSSTKGPATIAAHRHHNDEPQRPFTVLVVDDIADNIQVIADIVKSQAKVKAATSGKMALKLCFGTRPPDLIILDIMMPQMDGYAVIEALKGNSKTCDVPVMFVTAKTQLEDLIKGFDLGAVDYLTKPINPAELKARVSSQKRIWQYQQSLKQQLDMVVENLQLKEDLDRIVQHDLSSPLAAISALAQDTQRHNRDTKRVTDNTQRIIATTGMLSAMVANLFTISKIEDGNFNFESKRFNVYDLIKQVYEGYAVQIKEKSLQVTIEIAQQTSISGCSSLSYSLFSNLFVNALEAAPRGSKIQWQEQQDDETLQITLSNLGAVDSNIRERFFEKYITAGKVSGTGLGTYAAKLFIEAQKGAIEAQFGEHDTQIIMRFIKT